VLDVDIKGFFENLDHAKLMSLLRKHTHEKWVLMYVNRWLKAGVEQEDGSIAARTKGTPQGGVASPLLSNIYLHHAFDMWMQDNYPGKSFERFADDIIVHCGSKEEAESMLVRLKERMEEFALELHPDKTKIVYCRNYLRKEKHEHESFVFLSYSFQPRIIKDQFGRTNKLLVFSPAICQMAKKHINKRLREVFKDRMSDISLEEFARRLNPRIRGWINYYAKYHRDEAYAVFYRLNVLIRKWIKNTYKIRGLAKIFNKYQEIQSVNPVIFYHWTLGVRA
jgi:RNA-directed DNA polymerase